ncbi:hypothetical protein MRBLWH7_002966 [Microbacterium sp. LWH7-1.2]|uniref:hypothetical protein n=1 Tax=Microbacterium sp. LWH7-1.2 TaxID=3135257 RepID=UPI003139C905
MSTFTRLRTLAAGMALATVAALAGASPAWAAAPGNDDINGATVVSELPYTDTVDTREATYDPSTDHAECGVATVWYRWTPSSDGLVGFSTVGSDYEATLAIYTGEASDPVLLECNVGTYGFPTEIVRLVEAGATYFIAAGTCCGGEAGQVGPGGTLVFTAQEAEPPVTDVAVTVDSGVVSRGGVVTLQGTVTCDHAATSFVEVTVMQRRGHRLAEGRGSSLIECGPASTAWTFAFESSTGIGFGPGNATFNAIASAYGYGGGFTNTSMIDQPLQLRPGG